MLREDLTPAQWEAWRDVEAAERALELARLRFIAVTNLAGEGGERRLSLVLPETN